MKLNLGCGGDIRNGWINIDKFQHKNETVLCADIEKLTGIFPPECADEILAQDILEHISHMRWREVLASWVALLKHGGIITIQVPDIKKQLECFQNGTWDIEIFSYMVFGGQDHPGNYHFNFFTAERLAKELDSLGVDTINVEYIHYGLINSKSGNNANFRLIGKKR